MTEYWNQFVAWRKSFGLPNPGTFEQLHKESRDVFVHNHLFDGAKFDFGKGLSEKFHVQHSFSLGSQVQPSSYNFAAIYFDSGLFLNGSIDHEGALRARGNYGITKNLKAKSEIQFGSHEAASLAQFELDYSGMDYSADVKAINFSPADNTGIFVGSFLQSLTKNFAVGAEFGLQRPKESVQQLQSSVVGKYSGKDYVFTAGVSQIGLLQASYYQKVSSKVDLGAELQLVSSEGRKSAVCTIGGKWDFQASTFRGQIDTTGRVSAVLEEKMAPGFSILLTGDIDHVKSQSKFGIGLQMES